MNFNDRLKAGYDQLAKNHPSLKEARKRFYLKATKLLSDNAKILIPHALMGQEPISLSTGNKHWRIQVVEPHRPFLNGMIKRVESLDLDSRISFTDLFLAEVEDRDFEACFLSFALNSMEPNERQQLLQDAVGRIKERGYLFLTLTTGEMESFTSLTIESLELEGFGLNEAAYQENLDGITYVAFRKVAK